jgi:hypothetical protein
LSVCDLSLLAASSIARACAPVEPEERPGRSSLVHTGCGSGPSCLFSLCAVFSAFIRGLLSRQEIFPPRLAASSVPTALCNASPFATNFERSPVAHIPVGRCAEEGASEKWCITDNVGKRLPRSALALPLPSPAIRAKHRVSEIAWAQNRCLPTSFSVRTNRPKRPMVHVARQMLSDINGQDKDLLSLRIVWRRRTFCQ